MVEHIQNKSPKIFVLKSGGPLRNVKKNIQEIKNIRCGDQDMKKSFKVLCCS